MESSWASRTVGSGVFGWLVSGMSQWTFGGGVLICRKEGGLGILTNAPDGG